ncbi:MAG TPA: thymidine phosphorylase [Verrucomicrobiae bacterium]|nr:thymidine phosphorylase [Verrucomicrobiae bacterium]
MHFLSLIEAKRDGRPLAAAEIRQIIENLPALPDYQVAAFLMAVFFRGLDTEETTALTLAMRDSGEVLKFPADSRPLVDKHSTGGVGDKVSLPLAPLLACLGFRVPMISGRGLGITGGTLDKLESIPGFTTSLPAARIVELVQQTGCVICGQTERMVPADRRLYALRDVTGSVPSIPLITASILSKKLAESLDALVLDVKFGRAAFMQTREQARLLAQSMVALGTQCGVNTRAVLTDMNAPLGRAAGNWLEVKESVACLDGAGPGDLREIVLHCAAHLLVQTGRCPSLETALAQAADCLTSGAPRRKWDEMLVAQGADVDAFRRKLEREVTAPAVGELKASRDGLVTRVDARQLGEVVRDLGGGRLTQEAVINHDVGVDCLAQVGEAVTRGTTLARIHAADEASLTAAIDRLRPAIEVADGPSPPRELLVETLG